MTQPLRTRAAADAARSLGDTGAAVGELAAISDLAALPSELRLPLVASLDLLPTPLGVTDGLGLLRLTNSALRQLLGGPQGAELRRAIAELACAALGRTADAPSAGAPGSPARHVTLACVGGWQLHATALPAASALHAGPAVVVCAAASANARDPVASACQSYRLTKREAEVVALLARGESCRGVAAALFISHHTARRHTESVLRKFEVHSRAELVLRLFGSPADAPVPSPDARSRSTP
jgi:DNA-binding CsgD family transcriptional regulator